MTDYRGLILERTGEGATDLAISQLETTLCARLPDDYRQFLKACNGAYVPYDVQVTLASGEEDLLSFSLYALAANGQYDANPFELEQLRSDPDFPASGVLPIGRDGGASMLFLDLREGRQDVTALVAALPAWTGRRPGEDEYVVLADSFTHYLDGLFLSHERIHSHIEQFIINPQTIDATLEWLDKAQEGWREQYREQWNARVVERPI